MTIAPKATFQCPACKERGLFVATSRPAHHCRRQGTHWSEHQTAGPEREWRLITPNPPTPKEQT